MIPIIDLHLDLAWNALAFNRDLTLTVAEIRQRESAMTDVPGRGRGTTTLPELRRASIPVCIATVLARAGPEQKFQNGYKRSDLDYASQSIACAVAQGQLAYYGVLQSMGPTRILRSVSELDAHWLQWESDPNNTPLGIILSMEGADPILTPAQAEHWWNAGLRFVGPAHYGRSHYAYGTGVSGPLSDMGVELLREFDRLGMVLDVTHLCDESMAQALDLFSGAVWASHHNCRALVPGDRQLTDEQIKRLVARQAIIGVALDAWMLYPGWERGKTSSEVVSLEAVADHIERVCQIAGDAKHSAIGSDLDGGYGTEQTPRDLDTITDLQKLGPILASRGFTDEEIGDVFHRNALEFLRTALPA